MRRYPCQVFFSERSTTILKLKYDVANNQVNYTLTTTTQGEADTVKILCHNIRVETPMLTY